MGDGVRAWFPTLLPLDPPPRPRLDAGEVLDRLEARIGNRIVGHLRLTLAHEIEAALPLVQAPNAVGILAARQAALRIASRLPADTPSIMHEAFVEEFALVASNREELAPGRRWLPTGFRQLRWGST